VHEILWRNTRLGTVNTKVGAVPVESNKDRKK
jgi:hypothetical protein